MPDSITTFIEWITTTPLSLFIQSELWVIPTLQTVHILCVAVVLSAAAMLDLKLLGLIAHDQPLTLMVKRYLPGAWIAVVILAVTGTLLVIGEPARSLLARPFQLKMLLLVIAIVLTVIVQRTITANAERWSDPRAHYPAARITAIVSLGLWCAIIVAGRWIAYAQFA